MYVYLGPLVVLASVPAFFVTLGPAGPFLTIALLLAFLIGAEAISPRGPAPDPVPTPAIYRLLPVLYVPLQLLATVWAIDAASRTTALGFASLLLSIGVTTGVFGMLSAHELVHGKKKTERMWGRGDADGHVLPPLPHRAYLRSPSLRRHVRDSATARLGEGFYAFLVRTVSGQFREAWQHERLRERARGFFANRMYGDLALMALIFAVIAALWGWRGVAFFAGESAVGVIVLELFNYIAHYGLARASGRRVSPSRSTTGIAGTPATSSPIR